MALQEWTAPVAAEDDEADSNDEEDCDMHEIT